MDILEFATPEEVGVSSLDISNFIDDIQEQGIMVHSFMIIRHNKVCAECYAPYFDKDYLHRLYSASKSFSSMALGILVGEGKVKLDDRVSNFFSECLPENIHEWNKNMTVRDMLMMSSVHSGTPYSIYWDDFFTHTFTAAPNHLSGTVFTYETNCTNCICEIVRKVTGKSFLEFLKERALLEIGFSENSSCVEMPQGGAWGGSGILCTIRDFARFALLVYHDGEANGKQLLPKDYVIEAKSKQIDNSVMGNQSFIKGHGYGYQIWRLAENGYGFIGLGSQCAMTFPDQDLIFCITADTQGASESYPFVAPLKYNIINKIKKFDKSDSLPANDKAYAELQKKIQAFSLPIPQGNKESSFKDVVNDVTYALTDNPMKIKSFSLHFEGDGGICHLDTERGNKDIPFSLGAYKLYEFPETHYSGDRIHKPLGRGYRAISAGVWREEHKFAIKTYIIDKYFGNCYFVFSFKGDMVTLVMRKDAEAFLDEYKGEATGKRV